MLVARLGISSSVNRFPLNSDFNGFGYTNSKKVVSSASLFLYLKTQISQFFRSWFAVVTNEERHAAFETLRYYPEEARRPWLKKGRRAPDAKVREICRRLEATDSGLEDGG